MERKRNIYFVILTMQMIIITGSSSVLQHQSISVDYSPCSCLNYGGPTCWQVGCGGVTVYDIKAVFSKTMSMPTLINQFYMKPPPSSDVITELSIPADFLGNTHFNDLLISCPASKSKSLLKVNADAFRSSYNDTKYIQIDTCDLIQTDFRFLKRFYQLETFIVRSSSNVLPGLMATLPPLPNLSALYFSECSGWKRQPETLTPLKGELPPLITSGLVLLYLLNNEDLDNQTTDRILNWVSPSSANTLKELVIESNQLTIMPSMSKFIQLITARFANNSIPIIQNGSLSFSSNNNQLRYLDLSRSGVETIEPGAFQGDFSRTGISLYENNLTRFEELTFRHILQQMNQQKNSGSAAEAGDIYIDNNPIDCSRDHCHLAWLIAYNRDFLSHVRSAQCSNGTYFYDLNPNGFTDCAASNDAVPRLSCSQHKNITLILTIVVIITKCI